VHCDLALPGVVSQQFQHRAAIHIVCKNCLAIVTALDQVVGIARDAQSGKARHGIGI
jgi:hypothetical protein